MTSCIHGDHDFPVEDSEGAYCAEHGVTLLWHGPPIRPEDLAHDYPQRPERHALDPLPGDGPRAH